MKISVLMPAYNEEKNIANALDSLLKQSRKPDEIIVVNDASIDNTKRIVHNYQKKHLFIRQILHQNNKGYSRTFMTGYLHAKGDIIAVFDADSIAPRNWIENICSAFKDELVGSVGGPYKLNNLKNYITKLQHVLWTITIPAINRFRGKKTIYFSGSNFAFRKRVADAISLFKKKPPKFSYDRWVQENFRKCCYKQIYLPNNFIYSEAPETLSSYTKQWIRYGKGRPARHGIKLQKIAKITGMYVLPLLLIMLLLLQPHIGFTLILAALCFLLFLTSIPYFFSKERAPFHLIILSLLLYLYTKYVHSAGYLYYCILRK